MNKITRVTEFESLRGILALWVIINHIIPAAGLHSENWMFPFNLLGRGGYAVDVFIMLSGFVIFCLLDTTVETYKQFIVRRAFRLFPVYLICLIASLFMVSFSADVLLKIQWPHPHNLNRLRIFQDTIQYWWPHLLAHLTLFHGMIPSSILPSSDYAFVGQAWSISLEWQFYLVAPLCYTFLKKNELVYAFLLIVCAFILHNFVRGGAGFLPNSIDLFFIGALAYFSYKYITINRHLLTKSSTMISILPIALALIIVRTIPVIVFSSVYSVIIGKTLLPNSKFFQRVSQYLYLSPLKYIGKISYCIYMTHMLVLYLSIKMIMMLQLTQMQFFWTSLMTVTVGAISVSALLSKYIEYPLMAFGKKISAKL